VAVVVFAVATIIVATVAWASVGRSATTRSDAGNKATVAAEAFLNRYLQADGRVVRLDQGGDTVSEGQAYAMLLAVMIDDRSRFDLAWGWSDANLARPDGLWSWRWAAGALADPMPAADADLDAAWALAIAAERFGDARYADAARRMADAILATEVISSHVDPQLAAGPWAVAPGVINPSYGAPRAMDKLAQLTGDVRWGQMATSSRRLGDTFGAEGQLPPDWARLDPFSGQARPSGPLDQPGSAPAYGLDAARLVVWFASDCDASARAMAARWASTLANTPAASRRSLDGAVTTYDEHPAAAVATAAALEARGDRDAAAASLDAATALDSAHPTYYGSAWVAIGRAALEPNQDLACPPHR
jgi:endoglucanase